MLAYEQTHYAVPQHTQLPLPNGCDKNVARGFRQGHDTMNTISDYVKQQSNHGTGDVEEKIRQLRQRSVRHGQESERLQRKGDTRQASMHASIAVAHDGAALALESACHAQ
jgi:hypothetical protein